MNELINEFSKKHGVITGVCSAEKMDYLRPLLQNAKPPFVKADIENRIDPFLLLENAKSIIVVGCGYNKKPATLPTGNLYGEMSIMGVGMDYHIRIQNLLKALAQEMMAKALFKYKIFVDSPYLSERALACKAGLGFIGHNGFVISEQFGSFFNIGYMITDLDIAIRFKAIQAKAIIRQCKKCSNCIKACPGKALNDEKIGCDIHKCVAFLNQSKAELNLEQMRSMGKSLYGCDVCQKVCPYNKDNPYELISAEMIYPKLYDILKMNGEDFKATFKNSSAGWRGLAVLKRNAVIALCNLNTVEAKRLLSDILCWDDEELKKIVLQINQVYLY